jgi:capsular polysaccharide export protein
LAVAIPSADPIEESGVALVRRLAEARVGGNFWGAQPPLANGRDVLLAPDTPAQARAIIDRCRAEGLIGRAALIGPGSSAGGLPVVPRSCDPWRLLDQATEVYAGADNELALIAALCGKPLRVVGDGRFAPLAEANTRSVSLPACVEHELLRKFAYRDPFTEKRLTAADAVRLLASWRELIESNREIAAIYGIARWKRVTVDNLLWDGGGPRRYASPHGARTRSLRAGEKVLAWKARTPEDLSRRLEAKGLLVGEIEDGMVRSTGLGANCVPPLSIITDFHGAHFDPARPSGLELILQNGEIGPEMLARAAALRERLVSEGISKYARETSRIARSDKATRRVLVAGQVEDDRAVICGGAGCTNLDLVRRARDLERDAHLIYKPHPDVEAGHRRGHVPDAQILRYADEIDRAAPITALFDSVDAVHVITSLAGFEALMRGKAVITHGVPFYAGWGLSRDLGPVPARRSRKRSLDELVAATLILYPRYIDPVTRLPCPVEVLVERIAAGRARVTSPLVRVREAQGRLNRFLERLVGRAG